MKKKYVLFGAGEFGKRAIRFLGADTVEMVLDNNKEKDGSFLEGVPVRLFDHMKGKLKNELIVVSVSSEKYNEIAAQLKSNGLNNCIGFNELKSKITKERILNRPDYVGVYNKAIHWVYNNSIENKGIIVASSYRKCYPEVTGYYIPSLIRWGYRDLAIEYAKWLCDIQKEDGSWFDADDKDPYIFDSAQILKGLLSVRLICPEVDKYIIKGCNWILSRMDENGRLITPSKDAWGNNRDMCDEIIHIYCLSPIFEAGEVFGNDDYYKKATKIKEYYLREYRDKIMNFSLLSHFYAYLMEALLDIGEMNMAREAMDKIALYQRENGAVPAYNNSYWVCSTGLFQLALVWFRLNDEERGNKAFEYACKLQNESGGWYGSYLSENHPEENNDYFPDGEISWANKYFLDALYYKNVCEFERMSNQFLPSIDKDDGRYQVILNEVKSISEEAKVLDLGCGKGRYLKNLLVDVPERHYYATDLSRNVMEYIDDDRVICKQGMLTCIPWPDDTFDLVYCCEALEHAVDIESAINEMIRVTKHGGRIVIIDKPIEKLGVMEIGEWEQWIDSDGVVNALAKGCIRTDIIKDIPYEDNSIDGLFCAWIGTVN